MSKEPSDEVQKRPSKATLRNAAFSSVRRTQMRPRKGMAEAKDEAEAKKQPDSEQSAKERDAELTARAVGLGHGPDYRARMQEYRALQRGQAQNKALVSNRWTPIGPSAVRKGQAGQDPVISGRISSLAIAPDSTRIYAGAANGGVWRSDDQGDSWTPLMEAFDLNPQSYGADSQAVGALALVPGATAAEDILYVGSGEAIAGGADPTSGPMFGVGPIVSTDGGQNWQTEFSAPGGPWSQLEGNGFYALAVDPNAPERVLGATLTGLFLREPAPLSVGFFRWRHIRMPGQPRATPVTSVVAANDPQAGTVFYAACSNGPVFRSTDGEQWREIGNGLPANAGRITLAVEADTPDIVYAFTASFSLFRHDNGIWRYIVRLSSTFSASSMAQAANVNGQWNLALAVEPGNVDRVYLGGGATGIDAQGWLTNAIDQYGATLFRCDLTVTTNPNTGAVSTLTDSLHYIGGSVHPDVHAIVFPPGNAGELWVGCDGGVFVSHNPPGDDGGLLPSPNNPNPPRFYFEAKNTGLQTLMMHHLSQHPTEEAVLFGGTQDNGCLRFTGEAAWLKAQVGDCGFPIVNWQNPYKVLAGLQFQSTPPPARPLIVRSNFGGNRGSFQPLPDRPSPADLATLFYYPLATTPPNTGAPNRVAFGSVQPWISENFGRDWATVPSGDPASDALVGPIRAITFASADRFYAGTHGNGGSIPEMGIYRYDRVGDTFQPTRLDRGWAPGGSFLIDLLPFDGSVSDIAIDWADPTGSSIYVAFGGFGSFAHVWHYDGSWWRPKAGGLLDIPHNAIVVDPDNPNQLYVGADIGIWRSGDSGQSWTPFAAGLPDAAVVDLKLHPKRVLRAATHGRGVFEREVDFSFTDHIELFIRDTTLDRGKSMTVDGLDNPLQKHTQVWHWQGPDIKLDFPDRQGALQFGANARVNFAEFMDELTDDGRGAGFTMASGDEHVVYAQIHNRGTIVANGVQVMALITHSALGLPPLPWDYEARVRQGQPINTAHWETIGMTMLDSIEARTPGVARFVIPPEKLPPPSDAQGAFAYSVLILVHHPEDEYPLTPWQQSGNLSYRHIPPVDEICITRRLAAVKSTTQQAFTFAIGEMEERDDDRMLPFTLFGPSSSRPTMPFDGRLRLRLQEYPGRVRLYLPWLKLRKFWEKELKGAKLDKENDVFRRWAKAHMARLAKRQQGKRPPHRGWTQARLAACEAVAENQAALEITDKREAIFSGLELEQEGVYPFFLHVAPPAKGSRTSRAKAREYTLEIIYERRQGKGEYKLVGRQEMRLTIDD